MPMGVLPPRAASAAPFPYNSRHCCWMTVVNGEPRQIHGGRTERRRLAGEGHTIFAVWPGQYTSDLFVIDQPDNL